MPPRTPALIVGLDGATFDVVRPLAEAGRLPNLSAWMREGTATALSSTLPAMSFPAWSSFLTGLAPGRHGIFDFTQKVSGAYRIRFVNATDRGGVSLLARTSRAAGRVLALGIPATYPPEPVTGLLVTGFDAPVAPGSAADSASDPLLYRDVAARVGPWMRADLDEGASTSGWHERAVGVLLERIDRKTAFALESLQRLRESGGRGPDLMVVVFSESDTVAHHFWRDHDPHSPRHDPRASALRRGAVAAVYERLDAAAAELRHAFGEDAVCLVLSDHGTGGASRRVVHLNRHLAECGFLARHQAGHGGTLEHAARRIRDAALRWLPPPVTQHLFRRLRVPAARLESLARFAGLDWPRTTAFSDEANTQPGVWINLRGREAEGWVAPTDYERVRDEVIAALLDWKLRGGGPVVARARRREQVYHGPFVERAPDIVVELALERGYAHSLVPTPWEDPAAPSVRTLDEEEFGGGRGRGLNGTHRPEGILIATGGPGRALFSPGRASIVDVAPTVLAVMGIEEEEPLDGVALEPASTPYTPEEEARVAARLRALGYLE